MSQRKYGGVPGFHLSKGQRQRLAKRISEFFEHQNFPVHRQMDLDLADYVADYLPTLFAEEAENGKGGSSSSKEGENSG